MAVLNHLEPQRVFRFFEELCAIPHGSGNTKAVSDWLVDFAKACRPGASRRRANAAARHRFRAGCSSPRFPMLTALRRASGASARSGVSPVPFFSFLGTTKVYEISVVWSNLGFPMV